MENNELNFKYNECIKKQSNVGETIYHNICSDETYRISWGSDTWIGVVMLFIFFSIIILFLAIALIRFIFDYWKE